VGSLFQNFRGTFFFFSLDIFQEEGGGCLFPRIMRYFFCFVLGVRGGGLFKQLS
jgi:hypothetical protein